MVLSMNMLRIELINMTGEKTPLLNELINLESKSDYINTVVPFYNQYKGSIFTCHNEPLDLVINHYSCTFTISKFNNMNYNYFLKKIGTVYYNIKLVQDFLKSEKIQIIREKKENKTTFNTNTCPICFDIFDNNTYILFCLHKFHIKCIKKSIEQYNSKYNKNCPICRKSIARNEISYFRNYNTNNRQ